MKSPGASESRERPKRRFRFSLRTLLLCILVAAIASAALGWRWRRAQRQAEIVERIRATGVAQISYDYQVQTSDESDWGLFTMIPAWLRSALGDDFFSDVHGLYIGIPGPAAGPPDGWKRPLGPRGVSEKQFRETMVLAHEFHNLRWLDVHNAVVRRDALDQLTCWDTLADIRIDGCDIRDEDLEPLRKATQVQRLHLFRQPIGDSTLGNLRHITQLRELGLGITEVTDVGLVELQHFPSLEKLWLFHTEVTDTGMKHVSKCENLEFLELGSTKVGDAGVRQLASLPHLRYINLSKTGVTDEGVAALAPLSNLDEGIFFGTAVTQAGVDQVPSLVKSKAYGLSKPAAAATAATPTGN